jgi:hypothetical protein
MHVRTDGAAVSATGGSARSQLGDLKERSWRPRPAVSFLIAATSFVIPVVASLVMVQIAARTFRRPDTFAGIVAWLAALVLLATATLWTIDRWSRRLLPLAAMLRLSLVFPDNAPSRFSLALRTGSGKALEHALERATTETEFSTSAHAAALVVRLVTAVGKHDRLTRGHSERVRAYADLIGEELGLDAESRSKLHWAALLHDVGKLEVPASILNKTERLTADEWQVIRRHPGASDRWLEPLRGWLGDWALAATQHHERYDGDGYPNGLRGDDISLAGRIVAVADAFDVMTAARSYKKPYPAAQARVELANNAGTQFDPRIVRAFLGISLDRLRLVMGPLAWLSGLSGLFSVGSVASGTAAAVTAAAVATSALATPAAAKTARRPAHGVVASAKGAGHATAPRSSAGVPVSPPVIWMPGAPAPVPGGGGGNGGGKGSGAPGSLNGKPVPADDPTVTTVPGETTTTTMPSSDDTTPDTTPTVTTPATSPIDPVPVPIAHAPVANNDSFTGLLNTRYKIDVIANDTDVDGNIDPSTLAIVASSTPNVTVLDVEEGVVRVRVDSTVATSFTFIYQVCDTTKLCAQAKVRVTLALSILSGGAAGLSSSGPG